MKRLYVQENPRYKELESKGKTLSKNLFVLDQMDRWISIYICYILLITFRQKVEYVKINAFCPLNFIDRKVVVEKF